MQESLFPDIVTSFDPDRERLNDELYSKLIRQSLHKILPAHLLSLSDSGELNLHKNIDNFHALLPLVSSFISDKIPGNNSFFVISRYRSNAFRFFFEMITHWLIPAKRLNALSLFAADFKIPSISSELYTLCEIVLHIDNKEDLKEMRANLTAIEADLRLGMESSYYARRILEVKGVTADEKVSLVQELITNLIKRLPQHFGHDLLTEMQQLFVMGRDEFKAARFPRHLCKVACIFYLFRQEIKERINLSNSQRHLSVRLFRVKIAGGSGLKPVLAVVVAVNFLHDKEVFEKRHLLRAIKSHIPDAVAVEGSYMASRRVQDSFCLLYLEIERVNSALFTGQEVSALWQKLAADLKDVIEKPIHPVFMPRNEEEVMRNVLVLSSQIRFVRDIPQVIINFDEQTHSHLFFNVILVQVARPGSLSLKEMFEASNTFLEYIHERAKMVGVLRNKYAKEAILFRVKLSKESFLRRDHSIDLYKARHTVVVELSRIVGDIRDFNGGMIAKQNETLLEIKNLLVDIPKYDEHLLENFFFSMKPPVIRTLVEPIAVKTLFLMIQGLVERAAREDEEINHQIQVSPDFVFLAIRGGGSLLREEIAKRLNSLSQHSSEIASSSIRVHEIPYQAYLYRCDDSVKHALFCQTMENVLAKWEQKLTKT